MPDYHAKFGGSNAKRWKNCTGYLGLAATLPRPPTNRAAMEGTAQHSAMELMLRHPHYAPGDFLAAVLDSVELTADHVAALTVALNAVEEVIAEFPENATLLAERFYVFSLGDGTASEPEAGGSCDLTIVSGNRAAFVDFKFGQIEVGADSDQNRFYMASAILGEPELFRDVEIFDSVIIQPAFAPAVVRERHDYAAVDRFIIEFTAAIQANKHRPEFKEGDWCAFCPAVITCPVKTQRLASLSQQPETVAAMAEWYSAYRALETPAGLIRAQLTHELEHGVTVPGYKLVARRTEAAWRDEGLAMLRLSAAGHSPRDMVALRPPAQLRHLNPALVDELSHHPPGGNTIAPNSDTRPAVLPRGALGAALRRLGR
jgi:hypothetical protein